MTALPDDAVPAEDIDPDHAPVLEVDPTDGGGESTDAPYTSGH